MLFSSWLRNWKDSLERRSALNKIRRLRSPVRRMTLRLVLEALEDRTLLSPYVVTTTVDSGSGSLRDAITQINADTNHTLYASPSNPNVDEIDFNITAASDAAGGGTGYNAVTGVATIQPQSALPTITAPVILNAATQPGYAGKPVIVLDGTYAGNGVNGLVLTASAAGSTVQGFAMDHFIGNGIEVDGGGNNVLASNYIGVDATGANVAGNSGDGIALNNSSDNTIGGTTSGARNVISGNGGDGIALTGSSTTGNVVEGNYVGTDATGTAALSAPKAYGFNATLYGVNDGQIALNIPQLNTNPGAATTVSFWMDWNGVAPDASNEAAPIRFSGVYSLLVSDNFGFYSGTNLYGASSADLLNQWHFVTAVILNGAVTQDQLWIDGVEQQLGPVTSYPLGSFNVSTTPFIGGDGAMDDVAFFNQQLTPAQIQAEYAASFNGTETATILSQGPVAFYPLNETSGSVAYDASGNGNNGTLNSNGIFQGVLGGPTGNRGNGVSISGGASGNTIGGTATGDRNVISADGSNGVKISDAGTSGNVVENNCIGVDVTGETALANTNDGVLVTNGAANNIIGDPTGVTRDIISGNRGDGVEINGAGTSGNQIEGNIIGLDVSGSTDVGADGQPLGNRDADVLVHGGAADNTIGGLTSTPGTGAGNVISGDNYNTRGPFGRFGSNRAHWDGFGIAITDVGTSGNVIEGNIVGLDATGTKGADANGNGLGNQFGVGIDNGATNNTIGGTTAGARNIISNSGSTIGGSAGISISASNNLVAGNYIGTDITGMVAFGNGFYGSIVLWPGANSNIIGGSTAGARNVINGSINIMQGSSSNLVKGNYIGTNATGNAPLPFPRYYSFALIFLQGDNNTIGGTEPGAGNIISGNNGPDGGPGVDIAGTDNLIQGNIIGLGANSKAVPNEYGVYLSDSASGNVISGDDIEGNSVFGVRMDEVATDNIIGGTTPGAGNVISDNGGPGIDISGSGLTGNVIEGNFIGTNASGAAHLGNGGEGVVLENGATNNSVGGTASGAGNTIAFNEGGVVVVGGNANSILDNSIHDNANLGIVLAIGSNDNQAAPVLTSGSSSSSGTTVSGTLASVANTTFRIEFFSNAGLDASGNAEGRTYLGFTTVTTDSTGHATFTAANLAAIPVGQGYVTATATNQSTGDTSQFSNYLAVPTSMQLTASANPSFFGQPVTFTATVSPSLSGFGTPAGNVDFVDTTTNTDLGSAALSGGIATLTTTALNAGAQVITATYAGNTNFLGSSAVLSITVAPSILVLNGTASGALSLSGNASINIPGNLVVDSNAKKALTESGNASIHAASIQVVGGVSTSGNATLSPAAVTGISPVSDPLANLTGPSTSGLTNYGAVSYSNGSHTLNPGIYTSIKASGNASLTLNSGLYLIEGGGVTVSGNASISGSGVTIYNTSSNYPSSTGGYGGITLSGNGTFSLSAPTSGAYAGIVIFQPYANTRAISLSGNAASGLTGTIYAPAALVYVSGNASLNGAAVVNELSLSGNAASTQTAAGTNADNAGSTAGELLQGDVNVYVNNSNGDLTADELARIQAAVNAVDAVTAPYGVNVAEVTNPTQANVSLNMGTTSAAGNYGQGVLGCYTTAGVITLLQGWNWYAGADPTQIGANQYDFQTTVTHELGHALGLGENSDPTSAMYGTLAPATTIRTLTTADLNIPYAEAGADAQRAALRPASTSSAGGQSVIVPSSGGSLADMNPLFAELAGLWTNARSAYQTELSSLSALWQEADAWALQRLDALWSLEASAMGVSKDTLMRNLFFASQSAS